MTPVRLALLWHMHQPLYREPETGEYLMPWVRLHATRAYYDMAWILDRHPGVRCTVNFTPVLLEQLEDYVSGVARDRFLDLTARPSADLSLDEREAVLRQFFMVDWETMIRPLPRYWELLHRRGRDLRLVDLPRAARAFTEQELTDLQVLFNLAWVGFGGLHDDPGLAALRVKGQNFEQADVEYLLAAQRRLMEQVVPRWKALAERGQVELSSTPYYHPILPLVCDTDAARRALPGLQLPPRFQRPEDARWHVREAMTSHAARFGAPPAGMWPAEGSVSPEALEVLASEGVGWAASDEGVLLHSLPPDATRLRSLYRPWRVAAGPGRELGMLFRDRPLSDLIGFTYARAVAKEAVADFLNRVQAIGDAWARDGQQGPATVGVFLDGENAWEHYDGSGLAFLDTFYGALESSPGVTTTTVGDAVKDAPGPAVARIHSGSWIEASYRIWIGHHEDRQGWTALGKARDAVAAAAQAGATDPARLARATRHCYAAEGSDWFWWYGDDFGSEQLAEFDALFRGHVVQAALLAGASPPAEALEPIKHVVSTSLSAEAKPLREPTLLLTPILDGRETDFYEWQGSGLYRPGQTRGSMYGGAQAFALLRFGFDLSALHLRLDPAESPGRAAEVGNHVRVEVLARDRQVEVDFEILPDGQVRAGRAPGGREAGQAAFQEVLEISIPFAALGVGPGDKVALALHVLRSMVEVERLPRYGFVNLAAPDADFEGVNWRV
ncbi:MAG: glycoside hydrolase [Anaeromyxobacter sp.]|nr:glycoside hydrolase [Anaeromyxobacter sp.]MBL0278177.1 glycoside hydrolase [Anaeromyxobacter sp.]